MARAPLKTPAPRRRRSEDIVVNLEEFAELCGVTPPTMKQLLKDVPADADWLLERGRRGRGYKIAAQGGSAWYRHRLVVTGDETGQRQQQLIKLRLEMLGGDAGEDDVQLTGKQRYDEFRAGEAELAYRQAMGELVKASDIEAEIANAVIELRRQLQEVGSAIRRRFGLEPEIAIAIDELLAERLAAFVAALDAEHDAAGGGA